MIVNRHIAYLTRPCYNKVRLGLTLKPVRYLTALRQSRAFVGTQPFRYFVRHAFS